jgi:hypothetical protein
MLNRPVVLLVICREPRLDGHGLERQERRILISCQELVNVICYEEGLTQPPVKLHRPVTAVGRHKIVSAVAMRCDPVQ